MKKISFFIASAVILSGLAWLFVNQLFIPEKETTLVQTGAVTQSIQNSLSSTPSIAAATAESSEEKVVSTSSATSATSTERLLPPVTWSEAPICEPQMQDAASWTQMLNAADAEPTLQRAYSALYVRQLKGLSQLFVQDDLASLTELLSTPVSNVDLVEQLRREVATLWLNVIDGGINSASTISIDTFAEITTISQLLKYAETLHHTGVIDIGITTAMQLINQGELITEAICSNHYIVTLGNRVYSGQWGAEGVEGSLIELDRGTDIAFPLLNHPVPAPDGNLIAFQSFSYESGGPIFLYDRHADNVVNLNLEIDLTTAEEKTSKNVQRTMSHSWSIIGWSQDSTHLLLGLEGSGAVFWLNLKENSYRTIRLNIASYVSTSEEYADIFPEENAFIYATNLNDAGQIQYHNLNTDSKSTIVTLPSDSGHIRYPRISPNGDQIVYLLEAGRPTTGLRYSYRLHQIGSETQDRILLEADLGWAEPIWSPDGQSIAFSRKDENHDPGLYSSPRNDEWLGNTWIIRLADGNVLQQTFIDGAARNPVWSPSGKQIAVHTHDGQIGLSSIADPAQIWLISGELETKLFAYPFFTP